MVDLMQSEIGVQIVAFFSVVLLAILTYVFGFKSNSSTENDSDEKQASTTRQSPTRQSISSKSKKQIKSLDTPPQAVPSTPKQQQVKKAELKSQKQQVAKKSEVKQQEKKLEQEEKVQLTNNNEEESNGEWITVKDKKQKKNQIEEKTTVVQPSAKVKVPAKEPEPKKIETVISQPEALTANQEEIKEKKPKKDSIPKVLTETTKQPEQVILQQQTPEVVVVAAPAPAPLPITTTTTAASVQPKKTKAKAKPTVAEPVKSVETTIVQPAAVVPAASLPTSAVAPPPPQQQVPKLDLLTSSLNELNMDNNNESDWIQANSKSIKKTKLKQQSVPAVVAAANAEQVPAKNKSKSVKQANKQVVVEQPEIPAAVVVVAEAAKPAKETITVPKPLEAAKSTIFSPNTIAATIIESKTFQTSKAQLPNESLAKTDKTSTDNSNNNSNNTTTTTTTTNNNKKQKNVVNMSQLKQTNLSDSMILIDSNASSNLDENFNQVSLSGKNSSRTDSNQSSSESLQDLDVDGDDGWATITSKKTKRTTVRREQ